LPPAPTAPAETIIPSSALDLLRISGETQVHPTSATHHEMVADRIAMAVGTIRLCVSVHGEVTSAQLLRSTKYPDYDARLLAAVRAWRYKPYLNHGQAVRVCSAVTFQYKPRQ
jgi:TonB family protein